MELVTDLAACPAMGTGAAVTIGVFDGVHLGHQAVIGVVRDRAARAGVPSAVVTFDPHPATIVRPGSAPLLLTDIDQRLELLEAAGVDLAVVIRFDEERSREEPEAFVTEVLIDGLGATIVVVGEDFHFGRARRGNVALLETMGSQSGFEVERISLVGGPSTAVSSTQIRFLIEAGQVADAAVLLGRHYEVRGVVVKGDQRGRDLGFPTANVAARPDVLIPAVGIYAGWYSKSDGPPLPAAISVGRRPTFHPDSDNVVIEAYVLDFDGDLYDDHARVRFVERLRSEERYDTAAVLISQIERDVAATRAVLAPVHAK